MADFGSASANAALNEGGITGPFVEVHTQNNFKTAESSGVPGGISGPASALNNVSPVDNVYIAPSAYGTVPTGAAVSPVNINGNIVNPSGAGNLNLFHLKNPGIFEFVAPEF